MEIFFKKKWLNDTNIIIYSKELDFWDMKLFISIVDEQFNIINTYDFGVTRQCFGLITNLSEKEIIVVDNKYLNNNPVIHIQYFAIAEYNEENEQTEQNKPHIVKTNELIIKSKHSCGSTSGKLCYINDQVFNIVYGDLTNNDYINFITVQ